MHLFSRAGDLDSQAVRQSDRSRRGVSREAGRRGVRHHVLIGYNSAVPLMILSV